MESISKYAICQLVKVAYTYMKNMQITLKLSLFNLYTFYHSFCLVLPFLLRVYFFFHPDLSNIYLFFFPVLVIFTFFLSPTTMCLPFSGRFIACQSSQDMNFWYLQHLHFFVEIPFPSFILLFHYYSSSTFIPLTIYQLAVL